MDTQKLRQRILDLAIRGKLVPQDPNDEPASVLLERIRAEKERLIAEGKIKRPKAKKSTDKSHYQNFTPPFPIPASWQWVRLEDIVCRFSTGPFGSALHKSDYCESGIPIVNPTNIKNSLIEETSIQRINRDKYSTLSRYILSEGDIVLARRGNLSKCAIVTSNERGWLCGTGSFFISLIGLDNRLFLEIYTSKYAQEYLESDSVGATMSNLNQGLLENLMIPLPPSKEQIRIIEKIHSYFDIFRILDANQRQVANSIVAVKSKILDLAMQGKLVPQDPADEPATDMLRRINPKAKIITDNPHYPQLPDNWVLTTVDSVCEYGYSDNVSVDDIALSKWILELEDIEKDSGRIVAQRSKKDRTVNGVRHRFDKGDVLYSKLRTYLNKVLVAPENGYCTTEIIPIKSYECIIPEYLCAWLRSPYFLSYTAECCYGVKMPRLSTTDARKGIVPLPPINEQKCITQKLNEISTSLEYLSNSLS